MNFEWLDDFAYNDYSQFGEDGILQAIFSVIRPANEWCFECGASDGLFFSNTRRLLEQGWRGVLVEGDRDLFEKLQENSRAFGDLVHCFHETLGKDRRIEGLLESCGAPLDIDLAVIDVDGQDYYLFNSLLRYRPRVIVIEFDHKADVDHVPTLGGPGQAGERALRRLAAGKFYTPVARSFANLILVSQPLDRLLDKAVIGEAAIAAARQQEEPQT